ncbi:MAG: hypothetical protein LBG27_12880 [Spirochaetaceae bacterium]|jgi:hypothetical protein|nr:hypothetical protein [Spirochaetaceae bacterium]
MTIRNENARRAKVRAEQCAPGEVRTEVSPRLYLASGRNPVSERQSQVLEQEMDQARILTGRGHTVCLLPEHDPRGMKHPDAVVDGIIMEFKTVTGNHRKITRNFKDAMKKAENVFLRIAPGFSKDLVRRKLRRVILDKDCRRGLIIVHFEKTGETACWNVKDLR